MLASPVDEIKNRLDIVEVVGTYIKLQKAGVNWRALCPFHSEKKPSFFVSPVRQSWHCFGCSCGGSVFDFVMKIEGIEFGDALRLLAQKAGVVLKPKSPEFAVWQTERQRLSEICELSSRFFSKQLEAGKAGAEAKKYLRVRGFTEESIKKWRLGYAPDTWNGLSDFLVGRGYKREEAAKAGLAIKSSNIEHQTSDNYYDRFRGRIMFPIFDLNSQVIGFGGRIFQKVRSSKFEVRGSEEVEVAKYINTPQTLLYDKSRVLYGLDKAKVEIRKKDGCILVEGYTDVILAHQVGSENTVATSGTALTPYQLKILKRYTENLFIGYDMDIAGDSATKRGIDLAITEGFNVRVILMPPEMDPADVISKNPEDWKKIVEKQKSIMDFYFETAFLNFDGTSAEGKKRISKTILPMLKRVPNKIEQAHWIQALAKKLGVNESDVEAEMKKISGSSAGFAPEPENEKIFLTKKTRKELMEERIISLVLKHPNCISLISPAYFDYFSPPSREILNCLSKTPDFSLGTGPISPNNFSPQLAAYLSPLFIKVEIESEEGKPEEEMRLCLKELGCSEVKNKLDCLSKEIKKAEEEKNFPRVNELLAEFSKLSKELTH